MSSRKNSDDAVRRQSEPKCGSDVWGRVTEQTCKKLFGCFSKHAVIRCKNEHNSPIYFTHSALSPVIFNIHICFLASLSRCQGVNRVKDDTFSAKQEPARVCFRAQMPLPPSLTKVLQVRRLPNPSRRHFSSGRSACRSHHYAVMLSAKRFSCVFWFCSQTIILLISAARQKYPAGEAQSLKVERCLTQRWDDDRKAGGKKTELDNVAVISFFGGCFVDT